MKTLIKYLFIAYLILTAAIYFDLIDKDMVPESTGKFGSITYDVAAFGATIIEKGIEKFND